MYQSEAFPVRLRENKAVFINTQVLIVDARVFY